MKRLPRQKPRQQGPLGALTVSQRAELHSLFLTLDPPLAYREISERFLKATGITASVGSLCGYYKNHQEEIYREAADQAPALAAASPVEVRLVLHLQIRPELVAASPNKV